MKKNVHPFKQLLLLLGNALGGFVIAVILLVVIFVIVAIIEYASNSQIDASTLGFQLGSNLMNGPWLLVLNAVTGLFYLVLPVLIVSKVYYSGEQREFLKMDFGSRKWLLALAAIAVYLLLMPLSDWLGVWNSHWGVSSNYNDLIMGIVNWAVHSGLGGYLLMIVVAALFPAVCEELFFRVGLQQLLGKWFKCNHIAIVVTAVIFSLIHFDMSGFLIRFVLGLIMGYVFYYSRSIVTNVAVHFVNNAVATTSMFYVLNNGGTMADLEEPMMVHWALTALCTVAALVVFWYCFIRKSKQCCETADAQ